ncbi:uncharacterized protein LOC141535246 isoform X2 [Cotesia typhae]|uniref:uncharacterized protein LOC141535246 isoform X2 n=1 Tax=Cotesia typhae TaxID=2053667 RepID=UPI003D69BB26
MIFVTIRKLQVINFSPVIYKFLLFEFNKEKRFTNLLKNAKVMNDKNHVQIDRSTFNKYSKGNYQKRKANVVHHQLFHLYRLISIKRCNNCYRICCTGDQRMSIASPASKEIVHLLSLV